MGRNLNRRPDNVRRREAQHLLDLQHLFRVCAEDKVVRAQAEGVRLFIRTGGERKDLGAHGAGELQGKVAEPSDSDDADPAGRMCKAD